MTFHSDLLKEKCEFYELSNDLLSAKDDECLISQAKQKVNRRNKGMRNRKREGGRREKYEDVKM